ncbi:outer membrane lipoprotein-sorting protein [Desulfonatronum thioautotrophicum]|uniref:outer membrane lipoprotein-sorting protein n=1 Tax=Desulfonatronum thioautotrophicum TaxID=617001 RepID=UPI0009FC984E|nr:outer membrane lipoprotein-sorting protein [Desulfonatronum thioautotrophicum]
MITTATKLLIALLLWPMALWALPPDAPTGRELAQYVHDRDVGQDSRSLVRMELISARGQSRIREMEVLTREDGPILMTFIRFTSPADISGTGFLSIEDGQGGTEQFLYLPALNRTRRIAATQKGRSFVNTDFTYEDMERRPVDDSEHAVTGSETIEGVETWILESRPKPSSDSQYSLIRLWVAKDLHVPLKINFFDQRDRHVKQYRVQRLENIQGIWTETRVIMEDLTSGHSTVLETRSIEYNVGLPESLFTQQNLENW